MQFLYVLTSKPNDFYYEQFLLSAVSLKLLMPDAYITLLCDLKTRDTLTGKRIEYKKYISKIIFEKAPEDLLQLEVSRWLRTSMRRLTKGDFLFIDGDTIITEDLTSVFNKNIIFGACLDSHIPISYHSNRDRFIQGNKLLGFNSHISDKQYNGGVLYCADNPQTKKIFDRWHELWLYSKSKNIIRDQPSLNMAIYENSSFFTELDGIWNCQLVSNYLPYLSNAKIIHYFSTNLHLYPSAYLLASEDVLKKIKKTGIIDTKTLDLLKNPKAAFVTNTRVYTGQDMLYVLDSDIFKFLFFLRKKVPILFKYLNGLSSMFKKVIKSYMVKNSKKKDGGIKYYN